LGRAVAADELTGFDHVVLATGIVPRTPAIAGIDHPMVASYGDIIEGTVTAGRRVAIIGAGGIGFDVAEFLTHQPGDSYLSQWGIDGDCRRRGGLTEPVRSTMPRAVTLLQRKNSKVGEGLGKTTGWAKRALLLQRGVTMLAGVHYGKIDDAGLQVAIGSEDRQLAVDTVVICAGQEPRRDLYAALQQRGVGVSLIGGADQATELDAERAIAQGTELGLRL
jgi:2,4-dienoyl-CoA reductase (NADPH2)